MKEVSERQIAAGKDPMGLAASVLYVSCLKTGEDRNQTEIANASGFSQISILFYCILRGMHEQFNLGFFDGYFLT